MKLLELTTEAAMVAAYLKAEFTSERFSEDLQTAIRNQHVTDTALITNPDIASAPDNERRAQLLGEYRGYRQNREMFIDFPDDLKWYRAELSQEDIQDLRYVDYSYWNELSDGTHRVGDAVKNIRNGKIVFDVSNDRFLQFADKIAHGEYKVEPIIIWGTDVHSPLELLEGHLRATALGLAGGKAPETVAALVGVRR